MRIRLLAPLLLSLFLAGPTSCPTEGELYVLAPESALLDGCFGPCLCPVRFRELRGSFVLSELPTLAPGPNRLFSVQEVLWRAGLGDDRLAIRGAGLYENDPVAKTHRLKLRLFLGDGEVQEFDSGLLSGGEEFPEIVIRASENGELTCFDTVLDIRALPLPEPEPPCSGTAEAWLAPPRSRIAMTGKRGRVRLSAEAYLARHAPLPA